MHTRAKWKKQSYILTQEVNVKNQIAQESNSQSNQTLLLVSNSIPATPVEPIQFQPMPEPLAVSVLPETLDLHSNPFEEPKKLDPPKEMPIDYLIPMRTEYTHDTNKNNVISIM
jgi:hypothetical protein